MAVVTVYGASDDLIEVEGDLREEFGCYGEDEGLWLGFSDGTLARITYGGEGMWRIHVHRNGSAKATKVEATDPDGDYSDKLTLDGDVRWVVCGKYHVKAKARLSPQEEKKA